MPTTKELDPKRIMLDVMNEFYHSGDEAPRFDKTEMLKEFERFTRSGMIAAYRHSVNEVEQHDLDYQEGGAILAYIVDQLEDRIAVLEKQ